MRKGYGNAYGLCSQEFLPMLQLPPISAFTSRANTRLQIFFGAETPDDDEFCICSGYESFYESLPLVCLDLFNVWNIQQDRIAKFQVLFGNSVDCVVKTW